MSSEANVQNPELLAVEAKELFDTAVEMLQRIARFDEATVQASRLAEQISKDIGSKQYRIRDSTQHLERLQPVLAKLNLFDHEVPVTPGLLLALYDTERELRQEYLKTHPEAEKNEILENNPISIVLGKIIRGEERQPRFVDLSLEQMSLIIDSVRSKVEKLLLEVPQLEIEVDEAQTRLVTLQRVLAEIQENRLKIMNEFRKVVENLNTLESQLTNLEPEEEKQLHNYLVALSKRVELYQLTPDDVRVDYRDALVGECTLYSDDGTLLLDYSILANDDFHQVCSDRNTRAVISTAYDQIGRVGALLLRPVPEPERQEATIKLKGGVGNLPYGKIDECGIFIQADPFEDEEDFG